MRTINSIICHYTDSPDVSAETIRQWHLARGWKDLGYHKVIRQNGKVELGRPEEEAGAHTFGFNANSLGVVLTGSDEMDWYPSPMQLASLQAVLREWMRLYSIPAANIFFHREKNPTSCPGRLDKKKVLALLGVKKEDDMYAYQSQELKSDHEVNGLNGSKKITAFPRGRSSSPTKATVYFFGESGKPVPGPEIDLFTGNQVVVDLSGKMKGYFTARFRSEGAKFSLSVTQE